MEGLESFTWQHHAATLSASGITGLRETVTPFVSTRMPTSTPSMAKVFLLVGYVVLWVVASTTGAVGEGSDDHGDTIDSATSLALGSSVDGRIDPEDDLDVFRLDLSSQSSDTDVWIYATGDLDSFGELLSSVPFRKLVA